MDELPAQLPQKPFRGLYLTTEPDCLNAYSGAYFHIKNGFTELSEHFELFLFQQNGVPSIDGNGDIQPLSHEISERALPNPDKNPFKGALRDLRRIFKGLQIIPSLLRTIRRENIDFIYERAAYLSFAGRICSQLTGVKHYYEVNGIVYDDVRKYYESGIQPLCKSLTRYSYLSASRCFMVGGLKKAMAFEGENFITVQNGIEKTILENLKQYQRSFDGVLHCCVIAHLSRHHRIENLVNAISTLESPERFHFHFIGANFEEVAEQLTNTVSLTCHGGVNHHDLSNLCRDIHVGIIPGGSEGDSSMKAFTYGAFKMATIAPRLRNFSEVFADNEILFFENGNALSLRDALQKLLEEPNLIPAFGDRLYDRVRKDYTWSAIFSHTAEAIRKDLVTQE